MRIAEPGEGFAGREWPERVMLAPDRLLDDPASGHRAIKAAVSRAQRLELSAPLRFGADPSRDLASLRFLTEAAVQIAGLDWTLAGEPPWPVRTLVHLPPPSRGADQIAREYTSRWRNEHRYGLCVYRHGPGFIRIRDVRPGGPHLRVLVDGPWADVFTALVAGETPEGSGRRLLDDLAAAGLAITVGASAHVLPIRLRRWPIPYTAV